MYRKLILAGAMTAAFTAPAFAEWNVLKPTTPASSGNNVCLVVDRAAAAGEMQIAGPFATEEEGKAAADAAMNCKAEDAGSSAGTPSTNMPDAGGMPSGGGSTGGPGGPSPN